MDFQVKSHAKGWSVQALAEFLGTAMFLYLAVGGSDAIARGIPDGSGSLGTALGFGISLLVTSWAFFRISGAHFNPAITLSSLITGHCSIPKAIIFFISQLLGAMVGIALARATMPSSEGVIRINKLMNGESIARGFFLEFFLTFILCFVYHMIVHEKNRSTFMASIPYGFALFSCYLFANRYTGAGLNPARAFATSVVARDFSRQHWIYWFAPFGGAVLAAALHILFRFLDYETVNPGIDAENQAQYQRALSAYGLSTPDGIHTPQMAQNPATTTTTTTTAVPVVHVDNGDSVLPR
ncbi:hypothetical protein BGW38_005563 [Lunasporangiospora selenospora]|uniref:Aquaporin Z n=1 Tax=Lunasporangiospora selenospora TaxID=979761 RepID=A0A9P6FPS4_9FUNG|nr:hypothetical protein BGW38_005563 [Lunasporangiospora selenospora]